MIISYARTSTVDQEAGLDAQIRDLERAGADKVFSEQTSSVGPRPQLDAALAYLRDSDVLMVAKIDRLARSIRDLMTIVDTIASKGAALRVLNPDLDTSTPTGRLMLTLLGGVAEFERAVMLERQREGIAKARREGRYKGRKPVHTQRQEEVVKLHAEGCGPTEIARRLGMARSTAYKLLRYEPSRRSVSDKTN